MLNLMNIHCEVNPATLAIIAKEKDGSYIGWVMEDCEDNDYCMNQSPRRIMDAACKFFGSSLKGRQDGTRDVCGITHKAPISVDSSSGMYFFPTSSPLNPDCSWIAHSHIDHLVKAPNQSTQIIFKNGRSITLDVSHGSMVNQVQRTAQFRFLLDKRIKYLLKSRSEIVAEPFIDPWH